MAQSLLLRLGRSIEHPEGHKWSEAVLGRGRVGPMAYHSHGFCFQSSCFRIRTEVQIHINVHVDIHVGNASENEKVKVGKPEERDTRRLQGGTEPARDGRWYEVLGTTSPPGSAGWLDQSHRLAA
jgi:hypothetical protein